MSKRPPLFQISKCVFQIANPTVLEKSGALMLAPIYELLFGAGMKSLLLTEDQITIYYKTYNSDNSADMNDIIDQKLSPGKSDIL